MTLKEIVNKYKLNQAYLAKRLKICKATMHNLLNKVKFTKVNETRLENEIRLMTTELLDDLEKRY